MSKPARKRAYDSMQRSCNRAIKSKCANSIFQILYGGEDGYRLEDFPTLNEKYSPQLMAILDEMTPKGPEPAVKVVRLGDPKSPNGDPFDYLYSRQQKSK